MTRWKKRLAMMLATAMVLAACGGGGEEPTAETIPESPTEDAETPEAGDTEEDGTPGAGDDDEEQPTDTDTDESYARVTIDGTTYEFGENGPAATCNPDFFGGFSAVLYTEDSTGYFQVELWEEGTGEGRPVSGIMETQIDGTNVDLVADPEGTWPAVEEGSSFIEPFSYEGNRAEGSISFIDTEVAYNADLFPLDPVIAEFEVVCAQD